MSLSKEQILKKEDLPRKAVKVPEWGGEVLIRALTAKERDSYEQSMIETHGTGKNMEIRPNLSNAKAKLVSRSAIDDEGNRLFTSEKDVIDLGGKSASAMNKLYTVACELSGISSQDIEDLEKNSEPGPIDDSPTD